MSAPVPSFADFCRIWPMRDEAERAEARATFIAVPEEHRAETIAGCDALRGYMESVDYPVPSASRAITHWGPRGWAYIASTTPAVRRLMRGAA